MGKFGIGARVRTGSGNCGVIADKRRGDRLISYDNPEFATVWHPKSWLDVEVPADACAETCEVAYKVGDRVVCVDASGAGYGVYVVGQVYTVTDTEDSSFGEGQFLVIEGTRSGMFAYRFRPFTLEAGLYYKTRDGRKVGPMEDSELLFAAEYPFTVGHPLDTGFTGKAWRADGTFCPNKKEHPADIVAEWVEPAVEALHAQAEPAAKFNVGDIVNWTRGGREWQGIEVVSTDGAIFPIRARDKLLGIGAFTEDELELVPAAAEPKFKVGDRVDYVLSGKPQNSWQGTVITEIRNGLYYGTHRDHGDGAFYEDQIVLATPSLLIGQAVTATGYISGANGNNFSVVFGDKSYDLPATSLKKAA